MSLKALDPGGDLAAQGFDLRLWLVDLDAAHFDDVPSAAEQQRAARFLRADDGRRYLAAHAALRHLLGTRAAWVAGEFGKPALAAPPPHFNISRRGSVALIGVSATHEIGVDVEPLQPMADANELAQLHFTPRERALKSVFTTLGYFPEAAGHLRYWRQRLMAKRSALIEYK